MASGANRRTLDSAKRPGDALGALLDCLSIASAFEPPPGFFTIDEMVSASGVGRTLLRERLAAQIADGKIQKIRGKRKGMRCSVAFYGPTKSKPQN